MPDPSSPRLMARTAGVLYLIVIAGGSIALSSRSALIVPGDAAATAGRIAASQAQFRFGIAADLVAGAAYAGVAAILYELLKPVNRSASLFAVLACTVALAVAAANQINGLAALLHLGDPATAYAALKLQGQAYQIATIFFGFYCLTVGSLFAVSRFVPRLVGALMALAGVSWLVAGFANIAAPDFAAQLSGATLIVSAVGEVSLTLWLVFAGVNAARWHALKKRSQA